MKNEHILDAIGMINEDAVRDAKAYQRPKSRGWIRGIAVAACFCLIFAAATVLLPGNQSLSPFVLTAYAMDASGELAAKEMPKNLPVELTKIDLDGDFDGFLFSIPSLDADEDSQIIYLSSAELIEEPSEALSKIIQDKGMVYFYYIPANDETMPIRFTAYSNAVDGRVCDYEIRIEESDNGYVAIQENASISTVGGVDGPDNIVTKNKKQGE